MRHPEDVVHSLQSRLLEVRNQGENELGIEEGVEDAGYALQEDGKIVQRKGLRLEKMDIGVVHRQNTLIFNLLFLVILLKAYINRKVPVNATATMTNMLNTTPVTLNKPRLCNISLRSLLKKFLPLSKTIASATITRTK
jgi:hypothetical protein